MLSMTMRLGIWALFAAGAVAGCQCDDGVLKTVVAEIQVTPNPISFGSVAVGAVAEQIVEVNNQGTGTLSIGSVSVVEGEDVISVTRLFTTTCEGNSRSDNLFAIAPGGCARFSVRMLPKVTGSVTGLIRIVSDASNAPELDVPVNGVGVRAVIRACAVSIEVEAREEGEPVETEVETCTDFTQDPEFMPTVEFSDLPAGDTSERTVRIYNLGEGSLALTNARVVTQYPSLFVDGDSFSGSVEAGSSIDLKVKFSPKSSGDVWGMLNLPTNDADHPLVELPVVARGLGASLCMTPELGIDFGPVPVGETRTQAITFENCGYITYNIEKLDFAEDDVLNPKYTVKWVTIDGAPAAAPQIPMTAFAPGAQLFAEVTYAPQKVHTAQEDGDLAGFSIKTGYQSGRVPVRGKGASPGCNMGGPPTPVVRVTNSLGQDITSDPTSEPLKTVKLDASASTVPGGGAKYQWRLAAQPVGGSLSLSGTAATRPTVDLYLELAGTYEVELVVQDQYACAAPPVRVIIISKPTADLHIQLTWPERHGDVDLHLVRNGKDAFTADDCYWRNCMPSKRYGPYSMNWGTSVQNPTLDIDATWGRGPENINIKKPADGTYQVQAHYYCSKLGSTTLGSTSARVRIYVNGIVEMDESLTLNAVDSWTAATIVVSGGVVTSVTPSTVKGRTSISCQ